MYCQLNVGVSVTAASVADPETATLPVAPASEPMVPLELNVTFTEPMVAVG